MEIAEFAPVADGVRVVVAEWESRLRVLEEPILVERRNIQGRNIKQIVGHMIDSASNNLHRMIHLQYGSDPLVFPNYATHGNNDRWIAIQDYANEDWTQLVQLWKWSNLHIAHVMENVDPQKLNNRWAAGDGEFVTLRDMVIDYLPHLQLHMHQIEELID